MSQVIADATEVAKNLNLGLLVSAQWLSLLHRLLVVIQVLVYIGMGILEKQSEFKIGFFVFAVFYILLSLCFSTFVIFDSNFSSEGKIYFLWLLLV